MKHIYRRNISGFTLIELLVVIIIIGILASKAMMEYSKVIDETKTTLAMAMVKEVKKADNLYRTKNGKYARFFSYLGIDLEKSCPEVKEDTRYGTAILAGCQNFFSISLYSGSGVATGDITVIFCPNVKGNDQASLYENCSSNSVAVYRTNAYNDSLTCNASIRNGKSDERGKYICQLIKDLYK